MKTKTLLLAVALAAAGAVSAVAQPVYSVNAVGFVNVVLPPGFSMVSNPLNAAANTVQALFPSVPDNCAIFKFDGTRFIGNSYFFGWSSPNMVLNPGEGFFFRNASAVSITNTFVGEVPQGTLDTPLAAGFTMVGSQVPQAGLVSTDLKLPIADNESVYVYDNANNRYVGSSYFFGWAPAEPIIQVGQAFFVKKNLVTTWSRVFSVNQ